MAGLLWTVNITAWAVALLLLCAACAPQTTCYMRPGPGSMLNYTWAPLPGPATCVELPR
jgi:hypothetical protein